MRALATRDLRRLRSFVASAVCGPEWRDQGRDGLLIALDHALAPKRSVRLARKRVVAKKKTRREETSSIRAEVFARASGACECGCGRRANEWDHFFGGKNRRALEGVETTWALSIVCHLDKTAGRPDPETWLMRFIAHCNLHDAGAVGHDRYLHAAEMARTRIKSLELQSQMKHTKGTP